MYIKYISEPNPSDPKDVDQWKKAKGGPYRPTWLIRTSNWEKIPGKQVKEDYCALSYCWEQSGEVIKKTDDEYECRDYGQHELTAQFYEKHKTRRSVRYRKKSQMKHVTFDHVLQQMCKDFEIKYLWYDKICINQKNKTERLREIKQMHVIYNNARFTLAFVPEVVIDNPMDYKRPSVHPAYTKAKQLSLGKIIYSKWWKRSWTLEELLMSSRTLIVGENTYLWCQAPTSYGPTEERAKDFISHRLLGFKDREWQSANQVLKHAHFRTSSKEHDKVFALANIFYGQLTINIDYDIDIQEAMQMFYRTLAERDLSVMCFGAILMPNGVYQFETTMETYDLPSWTGILGLHSIMAINTTALYQCGRYTIDAEMRLHMNCRSYTIHPLKYVDDCFLNIQRYKEAKANYLKVVTSLEDLEGGERSALDWSHVCMHQETSCYATHYWKPDQHEFGSPVLPLSLIEECDECTIVSVVFSGIRSLNVKRKDGSYHVKHVRAYFSPVLKKVDSSYKVIGNVLLKLYRETEVFKTPQRYVDEAFDKLADELREFVIE